MKVTTGIERITLESEVSGAALEVAGGVFTHTNGHWTWKRGSLTAFGLVGDLPSIHRLAAGDAARSSWLSIDVDQLKRDLGTYVPKYWGTAATALNTERIRYNDNQ